MTLRFAKPFRAIVLDFPTVVIPSDFRETTLIPHFRSTIHKYLLDKWGEMVLNELIEQIRKDLVELAKTKAVVPSTAPATATKEEIIKTVLDVVRWSFEENVPLRSIGLLMSAVWMDGYRKGKLRTQLYKDVRNALDYWKMAGVKILMLSRSAAYEQKMMLNYTIGGNLEQYIDSFLDWTTGERNNTDTYKRIIEKHSVQPEQISFITDSEECAGAAKRAGISVILVQRTGPIDGTPQLPTVAALTDIVFEQNTEGGSFPAFE